MKITVKRLVTLLIILTLAFSIFGCTTNKTDPTNQPTVTTTANMSTESTTKQEDPKKELTIGIAYSVVAPFWETTTKGAEEAAAKLGVKLVIDAPQSGMAADQIKIIENFIAQKVDGIAIAPSDPKGTDAVIAQAIAMGIPVVTFGIDAPESKRITFFGTDHEKGGVHAADLMAKLIGEEGEVIISQGSVSSLDQLQRVDGFNNRLKEKYPNIKVVDIQSAQGDQAKQVSLVESMLQANPNVKGIYGTSAFDGPAIVAAYKSMNKKLPCVVWDDLPDIVQGVRDGYLSVSIVQKPYDWGTLSVETLYDIVINGKKIDQPYNETEIFDLTLDNVEQLYGK